MSNNLAPLGQAVVHWLWAFIIFMTAIGQTIRAFHGQLRFTWSGEITRVVLFSVGAAAMLICTMELTAALRKLPRTKEEEAP